MDTQEKIKTLHEHIQQKLKELEELEKQIENPTNTAATDNTKSKKHKSKKHKITLTEFWNSGQKLAIQCETWAQSVKLLEAFDRLGKKWCNGGSYLYRSLYMFGEVTCYTNTNACGIKEELDHIGYHIYKFKNVDLNS